MPDITHNAVLNQLLINLNRSLLQYVGDASPWTDGSAESETEREKLAGLIQKQHDQISRLTDLLDDRDWPLDLGVYPSEYTDLHYVALDYLLSQLIDSEQALVADIEETQNLCTGDEKAAALLQQLLEEQREIVRELNQLVKIRTARNTV